MLTKTITYDDYNGKSVTETVHFHLKKDTLTDHLELQDELEAMAEKFGGELRELTTAEKQEILNLVKKLIRLSYGVRSEDGSKFRQSDELFQDFKDGAGYDATLWDLFQDPNGAISFMHDVMPADLIAAARAEVEAQERRAPQDRLPKATPARPVETVHTEVFDDANVESEPKEDEAAELRRRLAELEG